MGHFPLVSVRLSKISLACLGLLSVSAYADETQGLAWLQSQSQTQVTASTLANGLQALSETSLTLNRLAGSNTSFDVTALRTKAHSTESLARFALLAHFQKADAATKAVIWTQLNDLQNTDGGFGHLQGWQSNPLDTAFVLLALTETGYADSLTVTDKQAWQAVVAKALTYLISQQRSDGSYQVVSLDNLYVSSYVLSALSGYVQINSNITPNIQGLVSFLKDKQVSTGKWSEHAQGLFIDALIAESLHPYSDGNTEIQDAFKQRALAAQQADGSWAGDAYVTAVVLDSLDAQSKDVTSPISSILELTVLDGQTNLPLQGAILEANEADSPQSISAVSNGQGNLKLNNIKSGLYHFELSRGLYGKIKFEVNLNLGQNLKIGVIKLLKSSDSIQSQIQGRVTHRISGTEINNVTIKVVMLDDNGNAINSIEPVIVKTSKDGTYQAILPQAGKYAIDVRKDGFIPLQSSGQASQDGAILYNPTLLNIKNFDASVSGLVVDGDNKPLENASIIKNGITLAQTNADGKFTIRNVDAGSQAIKVFKEGYIGLDLHTVIDSEEEYDFGKIKLPKKDGTTPSSLAKGTLVVSAKNRITKEPINGLTIIAEKRDDKTNFPTYTLKFRTEQALGNVARLALPVGRWHITLKHPAYRDNDAYIIISENETTTLSSLKSFISYVATGRVIDSLTKKPIKYAPIKLFDEEGKLYYRTKTDENGRFLLSGNSYKPKGKITISSPLHSQGIIYFDRNLLDSKNPQTVEMGDILLRPKSASTAEVDLIVSKINSSNLITNNQDLKVSGSLDVTITNRGNSELYSQAFSVIAFEDRNGNKKLDIGEQVYGKSLFDKPLSDYESSQINIQLSGKAIFRDAPIAVMVDSEREVPEKNEFNNIHYTNEADAKIVFKKMSEAQIAWQYGFSKNDKDKPSDWQSYGSYYTPIAAPLFDTNNDGKIGQGDAAAVLFYRKDAKKLVCIDGLNGKPLWETNADIGNSIPAIADLDNDGIPEIVFNSKYESSQNKLKIVDRYGQLKKEWYAREGTIHIADLNQDGTPEILSDSSILNIKRGHITKAYEFAAASGVIDINNDGILEIITDEGIQFLRLDDKKQIVSKVFYGKYFGKKLGRSVVTDIDNDGTPEIIAQTYGNLITIYNTELEIIKQFKFGNADLGGNLTVADFDNDGLSDIAVASSRFIRVLRTDGSLIWSSPVEDTSSGFTGIAAFDFNNDGRLEITHADEDFFRVYDGATGKVLFEMENSSGTAGENPIILDADGDGSADILFVSNTLIARHDNSAGLKMLSSKSKDWANTRNIWNQFHYYVSNINDDLSIPRQHPKHWLTHNSTRVNAPTKKQAQQSTSDLTTSYIRVTDRSVLGDSEFTVRVGNAGGKPVKAGTPVSFYRIPKTANGSTAKPELVGTAALSKELVGGNIAQSYEDVTLKYSGSLADFGEIVIVANDAGAGIESATGIVTGTEDTTKVIQEYRRDNNTARLAVDGGWVSLALDGSVDGTAYAANKEVTITAIPKNLGSFPSSPIVKTQIIDSAGNVVANLPDQPVDLTSALIPDAGNSQTLTQTWNTGTNRTGNYQARITLWRKPLTSSELELVATVDRPFSIVTAGAELGLTDATVTTDKASYTVNDIVRINSRLQNKASNQVATRRDVTVEVKDPDGKVIYTQTYSYDELAPNALRDQAFEVSLKDAKAGSYTVTQTVVSPDGSQADQVSSTTFGVQSSAQSGIGIAGSLGASSAQVELGNEVILNWAINNTGDVDLTGLPVRIELFKGDSTTAFTTLPVNTADIATGGSIANSLTWTAVGADKDNITAVLVANFAGTDKGLAVTNFTLVEPPIEAVINKTDAITDPLLVYYSCESGWYTFAQNWSLGKFDYPCFDVRENYLKDYLNRLDVPYKLVKTPWAFRHELQSGKFDNIWLLGAVEKLSPHTYKELREAAFMGDNVLVDSGMHSWLNHKLFHLAGMNYRGRLQLALPQDGGGDITLNPPLFTDPVPADLVSIPLNTQTRRKGYPFDSNWAVLLEKRPTDSSNTQIGTTDVTATFNGAHKLDLFLEWVESISDPKGNEDNYYNQTLQTYPAITQGTYGNGKPVALSFDLINSLTIATSNGTPATDETGAVTRPNLSEQRWDGALTQLLKPRQVNASNYLPLEPVRIPVVVNNKGSQAKTVTVTVEMPQGAMWLDTKGGATLADAVQLTPNHIQGTHTYQVTVPAKSQHSDIVTLRLPKDAGTHGVRITVATEQNGNAKTLDQQELRYVVRGVQERIDLLKSTVDGWSIFSQNGFQVLNLKTQLGLIKSHYENGNLELAVYEAARMGTTFSEMQNTADRDIKALRLEGDELLRALQMQWYQSRNNTAPTP